MKRLNRAVLRAKKFRQLVPGEEVLLFVCDWPGCTQGQFKAVVGTFGGAPSGSGGLTDVVSSQVHCPTCKNSLPNTDGKRAEK